MIKFEEDLRERFNLKSVEAVVKGIKVERSGEEFRKYKRERFEEIKRRFTLEDLKDNKIIRSYRDFYWRIGIDPTKIRPSSEALLRRVLGGKDIPEINNCVDSYNLASMLTLIAMGAYDLGKIKGDLRVRSSRGEEFTGIGGKKIKTEGQIVMADDEKILNIFPYRDSDITKVTEETKDVILVLAGVKGITLGYLRDSAKTALDLVTRFCGGWGEVLG
jgi:DNA/RNA-binding domain of Phe-tRNA-synthetase-like protein